MNADHPATRVLPVSECDMRKSITVWQVVDEWRDVYSLHPPSIFSTYLNCIGIRDNQFSPITRDL